MTNKIILLGFMAGMNMAIFSPAIANTMDDAEQAIAEKDYSTAIIHLKNQLKASPKDAKARLLLGNIYFETGQLASSLKELGRAHKLDLSNVEILFRYVEVLEASGKNKKALEILKSPLLDKQQESRRLTYIGNAHLALKQLADAKNAFEQSNEIHKTVMAYNGLAALALVEKDFLLAEQMLDKSQSIEKNNPRTLQIKAKLANISKQHEDALALYNQLIEKYPLNLSYRLDRAATLAILNKRKLAKADIDIILAKIKNHPQANYIKAQILLQEQDFTGAQKAAQQVVNVAPNHMPAAFILGAANFALKNYNQAEEYLSIYIISNPQNLKAQNLLANVLLAEKKFKQSIQMLEGLPQKLIESDPLLLMTLGSSYILSGDTKKGINILTRAQSLAPDNQDIRKRLIAAQFESGELNDAINELEQLATLQDDSNQAQTNYLLIISYIRKKQYDIAEEKTRKFLSKTPDDDKLLNLKALIEQLKGNSSEAIAQYQAIIKKDKQNIPAYMGLARIYTIEKNWSKAQQSFKQVIQIEPKSLKAYIGLAAIAEKQNKPELVEQYFEDAFKQVKDDTTYTLKIAELFSRWYQEKNRPEKILELAEELDQKTPNNIEIRSFLARAQMFNNKPEQAERTLTNIINFDKKDIKHRLLLAQIISTDSKRIDEAVELLNDAKDIEEDNLAIYTTLASLFIQHKKYDEAKTLAKEMQELFPDKVTGELLEADIFRAQKHYKKALSIYQKVYKQQPNKTIFSAIIDMLVALNQQDTAIEKLTLEVKKSPDDTVNLFKLASLHHEQKHLKEAESYYQQVLKTNPKHVVSLNNLSWIKADSANLKEAIKLAKTAHEIAPKSPAIMDSYGYFLVRDGQNSKGTKLLEQAITGLPNDKDVQYHLAFAYEKTGKPQAALKILEKIIHAKEDFLEKKKAQSLYKRIK